jgi:acetyl esterase/lipase
MTNNDAATEANSGDEKQTARSYSLPEALGPIAKPLEEAGIPIVYGPNPSPVPDTLSDQAKAAWSLLPQLPAPAADPEKLAVVRAFMSSLEELDHERFRESYLLTDETINGVETMWVVPPELRHDDKVLVFVHGGGYILNSRNTHTRQH